MARMKTPKASGMGTGALNLLEKLRCVAVAAADEMKPGLWRPFLYKPFVLPAAGQSVTPGGPLAAAGIKKAD